MKKATKTRAPTTQTLTADQLERTSGGYFWGFLGGQIGGELTGGFGSIPDENTERNMRGDYGFGYGGTSDDGYDYATPATSDDGFGSYDSF